MIMNWKNIRTYNGSQNNALEELECQLARVEKGNNFKEFVKVGATDSGVECFWKMKEDSEIVWQAKYVFDIDNVLSQASRSFSTALKGHPQMKEFILAIPFDLPDPSYKRKGVQVKSALKKWNEKLIAWEAEALNAGLSVKITLWDSSALLSRLCKTANEGLQYFWFHEEECTHDWFYRNLECSINDLGPRYSPELDVQLDIARNFEYLRRNVSEKQRLLKYRMKFIDACDDFIHKISDEKYKISEHKNVFVKSMNRLDELLKFNNYEEMKELPLQELVNSMREMSDVIENEMSVVKDKYDYNKYYKSTEYEVYAKLENILTDGIYKFENELKPLNNPFLLIYGDAGTGKSHLLADIGYRLKNANTQSVLLIGEQFVNTKMCIRDRLR